MWLDVLDWAIYVTALVFVLLCMIKVAIGY
jgi:hypothetical protein